MVTEFYDGYLQGVARIMVKWYCVRCSVKMNIETDVEPAPIRKCDGCGIENHVRPMKGEVVESNIPLDVTIEELKADKETIDTLIEEIKAETLECAEQYPHLKGEETLTDGQTEEEMVAEEVEKGVLVPEAEEVKINVTVDTREAIEALTLLDAQIAELEARKAELEEKE